MAALIGAAVVVSTVFFAGGSALAQVSYPPGTSVPGCTVANVDAGTVAVGQTVTFTLCGNFAPGASVTITVNGTTVFAKASTNGAVVVVVTVVSQTLLHVDDPTNAPAVCGENKVIATGPNVDGGTSSPTGTFDLLCTSAPEREGGGLAFTGSNITLGLLVALGLIALGTVLVVLQRRRHQTS